MIRAVIFDLDNTLVDFMKMKRESVAAAVRGMVDAGLDMSIEQASAAINAVYDREGIEYQEVFDHFLTDHYGRINHKVLAAGVIGYRRARDAALVLYPHVTATLTKLVKQGIKLALITDAPPKQAWLRLCALHLHHLFDIVITPDDTGAHKPSPIPFKAALDKLGLSADEAVMVGDWPARDVEGAKSVGMRSVFAKYGDRPITGDSGADWEINDISELLRIVEEG